MFIVYRLSPHHTPHLSHRTSSSLASYYAVLEGGTNGDGARRGLVTIIESTDPRPYIFQPDLLSMLLAMSCTVFKISLRQVTCVM
jgi:hypothetical protein